MIVTVLEPSVTVYILPGWNMGVVTTCRNIAHAQLAECIVLANALVYICLSEHIYCIVCTYFNCHKCQVTKALKTASTMQKLWAISVFINSKWIMELRCNLPIKGDKPPQPEYVLGWWRWPSISATPLILGVSGNHLLISTYLLISISYILPKLYSSFSFSVWHVSKTTYESS